MKTVGGNKSRWAQMHHSHRLAAYTNLQILIQGKSANVVIKWSDKAALSYGNGLKGIKASGFYGYIYSVDTALGGSSVCYVLITTKYSTSCNLREDELVQAQFCVTEGLAAG